MPKITDPDLARPQPSEPILSPHDVAAVVAPSTSFFQDHKTAIIIAVVVLIVVMIVFVYVGKNKSAANTGAKPASKSKALLPPGSTPETINMEEIKRLRDMRISQKAAVAAKRGGELAPQPVACSPATPADDEPQEDATGKVDNVGTALVANVPPPLDDVGETNNSEPDGDADAEAMFDALLDENEDLGEYSEEN
jgi:hypothetical protein